MTELIGKNVEVKTEGHAIILKIDASREVGTSKSGKSTLVATTGGNVKVETPEGPITLGINAYKPRKF